MKAKVTAVAYFVVCPRCSKRCPSPSGGDQWDPDKLNELVYEWVPAWCPHCKINVEIPRRRYSPTFVLPLTKREK